MSSTLHTRLVFQYEADDYQVAEPDPHLVDRSAMHPDSRRGRVDSNRTWRKKDDLGSSFEVLSQEGPATALSSPDRPELSEEHRRCAHFALAFTTLQLIPRYSNYFDHCSELIGGRGLSIVE